MTESTKIIIENNLDNCKERFTKIIEDNIDSAKVLEISRSTVTMLLPNMKKVSKDRKKEYVLSHLNDYDLPHIFWEFYDSELTWVAPQIQSLLSKAIMPACPRNLISGVEISTRDNGFDIEVYSWDMDHPERLTKLQKCVEEVMPRCREIYPAGRFNIRFTNGRPTFLSHYTPSSPSSSLEDDYDDDVNPNWPSRTGNPSGKGRGNNPPGSGR